MEDYLKKYGSHSLVISILLILLSVFLIFAPIASLNVIFILLGCVIAINGLIHIISYFSGPSEFRLFSFELIQGIAGLVIGFLFVIHPEWLSSFFPFIIGIWIVIESIIRFQISINLRGVANSKWGIMLILSILTALLGIFIMIYPTATTAILITLCGIILLITEVINVIEEIFIMIRMK